MKNLKLTTPIVIPFPERQAPILSALPWALQLAVRLRELGLVRL